MALSQFVLFRPVSLCVVTWCYQCSGDPGAELDLPAVLRLSCYRISRCPAGTLLGAQEPTRGSGVVSHCLRSAAVTWSAVLFGERSGRVHQLVVTRSTGVDGQ